MPMVMTSSLELGQTLIPGSYENTLQSTRSLCIDTLYPYKHINQEGTDLSGIQEVPEGPWPEKVSQAQVQGLQLKIRDTKWKQNFAHKNCVNPVFIL